MVVHTLGRSLLIAAGLYTLGGFNGKQDWKRLPRLSLGAALAIEVFCLCLGWAVYQTRFADSVE